MSFNRFVKEYLNFTFREKLGIAGLLVLIALFYLLPKLLLQNKDYSAELLAFDKEIAAMDSSNTEEPNYSYTNNDYQKTDLFEPFYFDPNTVNPQLLEKFGIPQYVIKSFAKYRNAGAKFYKKEDLKKLYGSKPNLYEKIAPYIMIVKDSSNIKPYKSTYKNHDNPKNILIELNTADSILLLQIKGIGPYLSSKIIRYRNALGGYVNLNQLYEIFSIKPEQVEVIKPYIYLNNQYIKRININTADYFQLNRHPYISSKEANAIINYRKQHGVFATIKDLEKVILIPKETIVKIEPYLEY